MSGQPVPSQLDQVLPRFYVQNGPYHPFGKIRIAPFGKGVFGFARIGTRKHFRPWNIDQTLLLPPSVQDFVPKDHVSRFIVGLVRESLDFKEIAGSYVSGLGQPPFDPAHDGRVAAARLCEWALFVAAHYQSLPRAGTIW